MQQHQTFLRCSRATANLIIAITISLFILIGCAGLLRSTGLSDEQAAEQTAKLKAALANATTAAIADIQTGLEKNHDLKTIAVKASSTFIWKILTAASATIGVVLNGLLAKWLTTEKKISASMIGAIKHAGNDSIKTTIKTHATAAGVEPKLHARVKALT